MLVCAKMLLLRATDLELIAGQSKILYVAPQGSHLTRVIIQDKCRKLTAMPEITPLIVVAFSLWSLLSLLFMPQLRRAALSSETWGGSVSRDVQREQFLHCPQEGLSALFTGNQLYGTTRSGYFSLVPLSPLITLSS